MTDGRDCRSITVKADDLELPNEHAAAFAILVTELVGNACKHGYKVDVPDEVRVIFDVSPSGEWMLTVEDDNVGIGHHHGGTHGLASHIIQAVSRKLGGQHAWDRASPFTRFTMWTGERPTTGFSSMAITVIGEVCDSG